MENKEHEFKVGELAWSPFDGFLTIEANYSSNKMYPLIHGGEIYTINGRQNIEWKHPTLLTVEQAAKLGYFPPKKKIKVEKDVWITVSDNEVKRVFHLKENPDIISKIYKHKAVPAKLTYEIEE